MSRLDDLIKELCPNGVEYIALDSCVEYCRGKGMSKDDIGSGVNAIILYGELYTTYGDYITEIFSFASDEAVLNSRLVRKGSLLCPISSTTKEAQIGKASVLKCSDVYLGGDAISLYPNENISPDYLMYLINGSAFEYEKMKCVKGTTIQHLDPIKMLKILIPVPPLPIQEEIVRILDNFTELTAELTAELQDRKRQYGYYRDSLFNFKDINYCSISNYFPFIRNGFVGVVTKFFSDKENGIRYLEGTNIHNGIISDNEVLYVTKEFHQKYIKNELKNDDVLMVQSGHIGDCAVVGEKYKGANCHALIIMSNGGNYNSKFLVHYFHTSIGKKALKPAITDGNLKHILAGKMQFVKIPDIPLDEQNNIVHLLDSFEKYCNDISEGLPAEIKYRQQQYEYYRDKLLDFKKLN